MKVIRLQKEMQNWSLRQKRRGNTIGFVPTMGALHEGHLALVDRAAALCDRVVVSIFVNPLQFGRTEDFSRYPRNLERDIRSLQGRRVDVLFAPNGGSLYPDGFQTFVEVERISKGLCGDARPGHFRGVATVVLKLFGIVQPDVAVFGRKDFQQWRVIERMVGDLHLPIRVVGHPIVRESDGLAMSSRNAYLSPEERRRARAIFAALRAARRAYREGAVHARSVTASTRVALQSSGLAVEYVEARSSIRLEPVGRLRAGTVLLVAVRAGRTRLIDNIVL